MSYPQITAYLRALTKLTQIDANRQILGSLANAQDAQQIQIAVQQRMGPYMCDNSGQQTRLQKDSYLSVLENYRKEIKSSSASQQEIYAKTMTKLSEGQRLIEQSLSEKIKNWEQQRKQIQDQCTQMTTTNSIEQLSLQAQKVQNKLSQQMSRLVEQLEIVILQQQLSRRKIIDQIMQIAQL